MDDNGFQCMGCKRLKRDALPYSYLCEAFPDGIPDAIVFGDHDHAEHFPGDHGLKLDPIDPVDE